MPDGIADVVIGPDVPGPRCLQVLPGQQQLALADTVTLGADGQLTVERSAAQLRDTAAWQTDGVSAITALAGIGEPLAFTVGQRPHCGSPMPPAPDAFADLTRLSVQPPIGEDCAGWFAVDLYVDEDGTGQIHAITVDTGRGAVE